MQLVKYALNYKRFMLLLCIFVLSGCLTTQLEEFEVATDSPSPSSTYLATATVTTPTAVSMVQTEASVTTINEVRVTKDPDEPPVCKI